MLEETLPFLKKRRRQRPVEERFWSRVDKASSSNGCWLWTGYIGYYGRFNYDGTTMDAHRMAWIIVYGTVPDGLCVLHDCPGGDNPACVNPAHLWLGTLADNSRDMVAKGRNGAKTHPERFPGGLRI